MAAALRLALTCGFACLTWECAALARLDEAGTSLGRREHSIVGDLADEATLLIQVIASTVPAPDSKQRPQAPEEHPQLDLAINDRPRRRRRSQKDSDAEDSSAAAAQPDNNDEAASQNATADEADDDDQPADEAAEENNSRPNIFGGFGEADEQKDKQSNDSVNGTLASAAAHSEGKVNRTTPTTDGDLDEEEADDEDPQEQQGESQSQLMGRPGRKNSTRSSRSAKKARAQGNQTTSTNATAQEEEPKTEEAGHGDAAKESEEKEVEEEVSDAKKDAFEQVVNQTILKVMNNRSNSSAAGSNTTSVENKTAPENGTTFGALEEAVKQAVTEASVNPGEAKAFTEVADKALAKVAAGALEAAVQEANVSNASTSEPQEASYQRKAKQAMEEASKEPSKMEIVKELVKQFVADAPNDPDKMKTLQETGIWSLGQPESIKEKVEKAQKTAETEKSGDESAGNSTSNVTWIGAQAAVNVTSALDQPSVAKGDGTADKAAVNEAVDKALALQQKAFDTVVDKVVKSAVDTAMKKAVEQVTDEGRDDPPGS